MPEYKYEARSESNEIVEGSIFAGSVADAVSQLESRGLSLTSIRQESSTTEGDASKSFQKHLPPERALEHRWAQQIVENRQVLAPALAAFAEELPSGRSQREITELSSVLEEKSAVETLTDPSREFLYWLPLLHRGFGSDHQLNTLLEELFDEKENRLQWIRTMLYPLIVLLLSSAVFFFLCLVVVPSVSMTLDDFGLELPLITEWVVTISDGVLEYPILVATFFVGGIFVVYIAFRLLSTRGPTGAIWASLTKGSSNQVSSVARLIRRMTEALESGATLPTALRLAASTEARSPTKKTILQLAHEAEQADFRISQSRAAWKLPRLLVHALQGEAGEPSIPLLRQLADTYSSRIRERSSWSTGFLAQIAIVGVGIVVFIVVLAMFLPLVSLVNCLI